MIRNPLLIVLGAHIYALGRMAEELSDHVGIPAGDLINDYVRSAMQQVANSQVEDVQRRCDTVLASILPPINPPTGNDSLDWLERQ